MHVLFRWRIALDFLLYSKNTAIENRKNAQIPTGVLATKLLGDPFYLFLLFVVRRCFELDCTDVGTESIEIPNAENFWCLGFHLNPLERYCMVIF